MVNGARGPDEKVQDKDPVVIRWKPNAGRGSDLVARVLAQNSWPLD
jgi:hypothetical protein